MAHREACHMLRSACHWKGRGTGIRKKRKARKRIKNITNHQARRPRAAHGRGIAAKAATSESDENQEERVEWGTRKYGVRMSPAHPPYVGRGDDACGGEVVYTIQEIRTFLRFQPEDAKRWITTGQLGWALTREENEVINAKDEREGKPVTSGKTTSSDVFQVHQGTVGIGGVGRRG